ncbi:hypothetical protein [Falsibacillus albus]|uniref:Uncharacterized protein n=1 Tax=Falsibacillus albus TaxID=2478915 RepID=A0A3L7JGZ4_9BACI|nr:hypothetical protein [Falsibacillus albus]RLQ89953.1 hypothetical protein D9X91_22165 [Falsibacillus albus]
MYVQISRPERIHGFGQKIHIKPIRKEKVQYIKVKAIPHEDSEEVKRIKEKWKQMKEKRTNVTSKF